jgi:hypothetical protein
LTNLCLGAIELGDHKHEIKKTRVCFVEFDDVDFSKLVKSTRYFGEGNSRGRKKEFVFEYCLGCSLRLLDGEPVLTRDILQDEFERFVVQAKNNRYVDSAEITVQHSDFDSLERLIKSALELGKLKEDKK